ncbi:hypothetical protein RND15_39675 [Streptomyces sp. DSM 41529]|uniref:FXSXX-COOH protein n=1 Tax=Streptomyces lonegramiae TaxID=3075524 RepID=A0ABU2XS52_9ACTN|nr:hypothetical protein [Streptomyces sp. DSM 41529]
MLGDREDVGRMSSVSNSSPWLGQLPAADVRVAHREVEAATSVSKQAVGTGTKIRATAKQ